MADKQSSNNKQEFLCTFIFFLAKTLAAILYTCIRCSKYPESVSVSTSSTAKSSFIKFCTHHQAMHILILTLAFKREKP